MSTLGSSKAVLSTNKYLDFKVRLASIQYFLVRFMENPSWDSLLSFHFVEVKVKERSELLTVQRKALEQTIILKWHTRVKRIAGKNHLNLF